ncbi:MAG: FAD-dependent oxidoreductase [Acidobacteria bacterium]|nr:FAD-dependent oxidoreductase [Acidobacteriota bacterium]
MVRDLASLASTRFDTVIVGGGVYGLATAWELASRGVSVALVERGDFAGATSFNSLKTVHGGIRALQHGALGEMREFVRERRAIAMMAPHLVRPLPFIVPTYRHPVRNRLAMGLFFATYDRLSADRNAGVDPSRALPRSRTVGRAECLRLNPAIDPDGVTGGAIWHDYQMHSPERFALALLQSAVDSGAAVANYVEATALLIENGRVQGLRVLDRPTGTPFDIRATTVVNAAGPWARRLPGPASLRRPRWSVAMNLVFDRAPLPHAVGGMAAGRFLFMVPWRNRSIVGTSHDEHVEPGDADPLGAADPPERLALAPHLIEAFLRDAQAAFPGGALGPDQITLVHRGLLPAGAGRGTLLKRSIVHDHGSDGLAGLLTVVGVRYTTARATAQRAAHCIGIMLGRTLPASATARRTLAGGDIPNVARYEREQCAASALPLDQVVRLIATYGTGHVAVASLIRADPALGAPLSATCAVTRAEILYAARHEMALHLADALLRRTHAGAGGHPGAPAVESAADVMATELGWTAGQRATEVEAVDEFYTRPA